MRRLHDISPSNPMAWLWAASRGGNGRWLDNGRAHLYEIPRGNPPPLQTDPTDILQTRTANGRMYWMPYNVGRDLQRNNRTFTTNPACGRLRTRSRFPVLSLSTNRWGRPDTCGTCETLYGGAFHDALRNADPWYTIPQHERPHTPDPVSGG